MINQCKVIFKDGHQFVTMPNGDILPGQIWTRVYDGVAVGDSYDIIKVRVDLQQETTPISHFLNNPENKVDL